MSMSILVIGDPNQIQSKRIIEITKGMFKHIKMTIKEYNEIDCNTIIRSIKDFSQYYNVIINTIDDLFMNCQCINYFESSYLVDMNGVICELTRYGKMGMNQSVFLCEDLNMRKSIPEIGKKYTCFDDGKITPSRKYTVEITDVIPFEKCDTETMEIWEYEVSECYWLYDLETDFFVKTKKDDDTEIFVRTLDGGWFGIGGFMNCGRLDVDGELNEYLESLYREVD